jgi:hypothetical protein
VFYTCFDHKVSDTILVKQTVVYPECEHVFTHGRTVVCPEPDPSIALVSNSPGKFSVHKYGERMVIFLGWHKIRQHLGVYTGVLQIIG